MAKLYAQHSGYGIDNSPKSDGVQFVNVGPNSNGVFDSNRFQFATAFNEGGHGWYEGSGFSTRFSGGERVPTGGTVNTINVDFDGGNTQDVSVSQISIALTTLFPADWLFFQETLWSGDDLFHGSAHADRLVGYDGDDTMFGGYGDKPSSGTFDPGETVSPEFFTDDGDDVIFSGGGHDTIDGGTGDDSMYGGSGDDLIFGGGGLGDDKLWGGKGADDMRGGDGNDRYWVDDAGDAVVEVAGEGSDTVIAARSFQLGEHVEHLTLTNKAGDARGVGNTLGNGIQGNKFDNVLIGGKGSDNITAGKGDDKVNPGEGGDFLFVKKGDGRDVILKFDFEEDFVVFGRGVSGLEDVEISQQGRNVVVDYGKASDALVFKKTSMDDFDETHLLF